MNLNTHFQEFARLTRAGETLAAIDNFYADDIQQFENTDDPIIGKEKLRELEVANLDRVTFLQIDILNEVIDEEQQIVWGEFRIQFTNKKLGKMRLNEAFFQRWRDGKIIEFKFFYKEIEAIGLKEVGE